MKLRIVCSWSAVYGISDFELKGLIHSKSCTIADMLSSLTNSQPKNSQINDKIRTEYFLIWNLRPELLVNAGI